MVVKINATQVVDKMYRERLYQQYAEYYGVDEEKLETIIMEHEEELQKSIDKMYVKIDKLKKETD